MITATKVIPAILNKTVNQNLIGLEFLSIEIPQYPALPVINGFHIRSHPKKTIPQEKKWVWENPGKLPFWHLSTGAILTFERALQRAHGPRAPL
jgi:hypothetical protein